MNKLLNFLQCLESQKIWYRLEHVRDSILVLLSIPGERWEVEFFSDGRVEIERFVSTGEIENESILKKLDSNCG